jgi:hypothetical protein
LAIERCVWPATATRLHRSDDRSASASIQCVNASTAEPARLAAHRPPSPARRLARDRHRRWRSTDFYSPDRAAKPSHSISSAQNPLRSTKTRAALRSLYVSRSSFGVFVGAGDWASGVAEVAVVGLVLGSGVAYPKSRLFRMLSRSRWISSRAWLFSRTHLIIRRVVGRQRQVRGR